LLRSFIVQALIFFLAFQGISFLRETSMLSTDVKLSAHENQTMVNVPTLMGDKVTIASQGKKTIVYFFAPWCQVCHVSIGNLQSLYEKNEHLDVIAVALDYDNTDDVMDFTKRHQLTFPIALGNSAIKNSFSVSGYPSYYVLNEENIIIGKSMGYSSELGLYLRSL
jgi:peroxiredoxin